MTRTPERNNATLAAFVIIDNAFMRAGLTAFRWIAPQLIQHVYVTASAEAALDEALRALTAHGTPFVGDLPGLRRALQSERGDAPVPRG